MTDVLQICPNDHPPFLDVCRNHARALERIGLGVETVFLASRTGAPAADCTYLDAAALRRRGHACEVILTHRFKGYLAGDACRGSARRHVAVAHEFGFFARRGRRLRQRWHHPDVVFAGVSRAVADDLEASHPRIAPAVVLPNAVDVEGLVASLRSRADARRELGVAEDAFVVGVVGRLHPKKNPSLALEGFARAHDALGAAQLVFVGAGELGGSLRAAAARSSAAGRVRFAGFVPDAATLMPAFDVLLVASTEREAFGMTLVEAMVAGIPVVSADRPGPREVLGDVGRFFDGADAKDLAAALRRVAAERYDPAPGRQRVAERFSIEALARRFERFLLRGP